MSERITVQLWPDGAARLIEQLTLRISQMTATEDALRNRINVLTDEVHNLKKNKQELTDQLAQLAAELVDGEGSSD